MCMHHRGGTQPMRAAPRWTLGLTAHATSLCAAPSQQAPSHITHPCLGDPGSESPAENTDTPIPLAALRLDMAPQCWRGVREAIKSWSSVSGGIRGHSMAPLVGYFFVDRAALITDEARLCWVMVTPQCIVPVWVPGAATANDDELGGSGRQKCVLSQLQGLPDTLGAPWLLDTAPMSASKLLPSVITLGAQRPQNHILLCSKTPRLWLLGYFTDPTLCGKAFLRFRIQVPRPRACPGHPHRPARRNQDRFAGVWPPLQPQQVCAQGSLPIGEEIGPRSVGVKEGARSTASGAGESCAQGSTQR